MSDFLISGWRFSQGKSEPLATLTDSVLPDHWYHCQRDAASLREWLQTQDLPEPLIDSLLADDTRPRFESYGKDCFLFILRGINLNAGAEPDDMLSIRILWYRGALISTRKLPSKAVTTLIEALQQGAGPCDISELLVSMINRISDAIAAFLHPIEEQLIRFDTPDVKDLDELNALYSRLLRLRRYLKPQRYALDDLLQANVPSLQQQEHHLKNALDTVARLNESIDFYLEQINQALSHIHQVQTQIMNRNTYLFSVIAGIFLPAGFFTGLLGVNVGGIPGTDNPIAFTILCACILIVVVAEVILLRKMRFL
ncbi:zinc transporter ZntB [Vibrio sp. Isolate23]|uniref:CorA family divalent cation transporter n=1 Tax=Vibrio sp. Isolate23 TaxID=2908533 RepID=UPI001EFEED0B|nr:CorA family divalent cation transporter [Vibrio sp. Isolate23]MCG9683259.1 zinc transporter ZntB [Vibrio sp. Isolate23]